LTAQEAAAACGRRQMSPRRRNAVRRRGLPTSSERLDHRKDHDTDHENGRYLIENAIESLRMAIAVGGEFAHVAHKKAMQGGERDNQDQLGMQPASGIKPSRPCEPYAKRPTRHHGRRNDRGPHPPPRAAELTAGRRRRSITLKVSDCWEPGSASQ